MRDVKLFPAFPGGRLNRSRLVERLCWQDLVMYSRLRSEWTPADPVAIHES